jgi:signal transduction histidine kinase
MARLVIWSFAGTLALFVVAMAATQLMATGIRGDAISIANNSAPSVATLSEARTELRHLEVLIDDFLEHRMAGRDSSAEGRQLQSAKLRLQANWKEYLDLPLYAGELALRGPVTRDLDRVVATVEAARVAPPQQVAAAETALDQVKVAIEQLDRSMRRLIVFNLDQQIARAATIESTWRNSLAVSAVSLSLLVVFIVLTGWSIARLVKQNAMLLEQRASELEAFSAAVAHDLVSPLAAVTLTLSLARTTVKDDPRLESLFDRSAESVKRVGELVDGLYRYAAAGGRPDRNARCDLGVVLKEAVVAAETRAAERHAEVRLDEPPPIALACSPGVLLSMVSNLVDNALKHMGERDPRRVEIHVREVGRAIRVEVADTGPGVPPERARTLFDPYVRGRTATPGLGLGLATVKRLAEGHGGAVGVESEIGKGSTFWFELPRAA